MPPHFIDPWVFGAEIIFSIIAVLFCFVIYFKTKELYDLTKYEGIKYFRYAFLFFGLSYIIRFLFSMIFLSRIAIDSIMPGPMFMAVSILILGYISTIGIFYLALSSIWKKINNKSLVILIILGHSIAVLLSFVSFITRSHFVLLYLQSAVLIIVIAMSIFTHKLKKKMSQIKILTLLIAILWLINLWVIGRTGRRLPFFGELELVSYGVSLIVFVVIYYKISKWVK